VARDEHGPALLREPAQEAPQPVDGRGIEAVGRLVENQQLGVAEQGPGQSSRCRMLVTAIIRREVGVMATSAAVVALLAARAQGWL
jgi:hypothetical protein